MPLTESGKKALRKFIERYDGEKGTGFFYAYIKKFPERTMKWHD